MLSPLCNDSQNCVVGLTVLNIAGEIVRLKQISRGLDEHSTLQTDIIINGHVPSLSDTSNIRVLPYVEDFVQVAAGTCSIVTLQFRCVTF